MKVFIERFTAAGAFIASFFVDDKDVFSVNGKIFDDPGAVIVDQVG